MYHYDRHSVKSMIYGSLLMVIRRSIMASVLEIENLN